MESDLSWQKRLTDFPPSDLSPTDLSRQQNILGEIYDHLCVYNAVIRATLLRKRPPPVHTKRGQVSMGRRVTFQSRQSGRRISKQSTGRMQGTISVWQGDSSGLVRVAWGYTYTSPSGTVIGWTWDGVCSAAKYWPGPI